MTPTRLFGARWIAPAGVPGEIMASAARSGSLLVRYRLAFAATAGARLRIAISANNRYKLWVNGARAGSGPCRGDRWRHFYDVRDISGLLATEANVVGVEVVYQFPRLYRDGAKTGLMGEPTNAFGPLLAIAGAVVGADGSIGAPITTGTARWLADVDAAIRWDSEGIGIFAPIGAFERVDLARVPVGWTNPLTPAPSWEPAVARWEADGAAWGETCPLPPRERPIPLLEEIVRSFAGAIPPTTVPAHSSFAVDLDAGGLTTAWPVIEVAGGRGARLSLRYAECYAVRESKGLRKGVRDDPGAGDLHGFEDRITASGAVARYEPFRWRTFRFLRLSVETADEPITVETPTYVETGYPLGEVSEVDSSAPWVRRVFDVSLRTLRRCMHETFADCPYHEQVQYLLDARLEALYAYAACADAGLARKALEDFHASLTPGGLVQSRAPADEPNLIPGFALHWVMMIEEYWQHTGDAEPTRRYRPTVDAVLAWFDRRIGGQGLVERLWHWEFIDWAPEWTNEQGQLTGIPRASREGPVTTTNLLYAAALDAAARMAEATGRAGTADEYRARAAAIRAAVRRCCWAAGRGMYREGPTVEEYTRHAQAWAVLCGLATGDHARQVLENALAQSDVVRCTFPAQFFFFRALERAGLYDRTGPLWEPWTRELDRHLSTWPEDSSRQRSDCHGWSAVPLYELTRCVLGVASDGIGWRGLRVRPLPGALPDARGRVMSPRGPVEVAWTNDGGRFHLRGRSPDGLPTRLIHPDGTTIDLPEGGRFPS